MKPDIALIMPSFKGGFTQDSIPLSLAYLAAVLKKNGFRVKGFNLFYDKLSDEEIRQYQVFGITSTSPSFSEAMKLAKRIKRINKQSSVVLGGPHATFLKGSLLKTNDCVDFIIYGEGEIPFLELIKSLGDEKARKDVPNLIYRQGKRIVTNKDRYFLKDLDRLPFPDKNCFDVSNYPDRQKAYGDIIASRGCPFFCTNCKPGLDLLSPYRLRNYKKVVDELEFLKNEYNVRHFSFSDSELAGPKKWVIDFCKEIINRKLKITFSCNGRTDQVDEEVIRMLKKAGCVFIGYGIESGSQAVINNILKKGINLERSREIVKLTLDNGIGVGTWFMVGIPGETWDDVKRSIEYAKMLESLVVEVNIATPWPETGFYILAKRKGWLSLEDFSKFNEKNRAVISTPYLSSLEVIRAFTLFKTEMKKAGWKIDKKSNRMYHHNFLLKTAKLNTLQIIQRGIQLSDFKRVINFGKILFQ